MAEQQTRTGVIEGHHITWWVYATGSRDRVRHTGRMRGHWPGWDATCQCGWDSSTGGATKGSVTRDAQGHKLMVTLRSR